MPAHKKPGKKLTRPKLEIRATQEWLDSVAKGAAAWSEAASEYARKAIQRQLVADGIRPPGEGLDPGKPEAARKPKRKGKP